MIRSLILTGLAGCAAAAQQPATVDLRADQQILYVLVERLAKQCDAGLIVDHNLQDRLGTTVTLVAKDAPWNDAIAMLASEYHLTVRLVGNRLEVTDADTEARKRLETRIYDVRTMLVSTPDFPGPELATPAIGTAAARYLPGIESEALPNINELVELVQHQIAPSSWTDGLAKISESGGMLTVTQSPEIQRQVAGLLARLERSAARQVVVRCFRLTAAPAAATVDAATWKSLGADLQPAAVFVTQDEQQNHHAVLEQRNYVGDLDIVQGIYDPVVATIARGLVVDVQPSVTNQGVVATVKLAASADQKLPTTKVQAGDGRWLADITLPDASFDSAKDTRLIPSGGAAIYQLGGRIYAITCEVLDYTK
ncbi:hypothetical protein LBMAG53_34190 [Planctomycetota bacterium]|nr:hypothetical protein LBMAG53_34190 [Planctomycetota bacterium]